jgi:hypothetical protein
MTHPPDILNDKKHIFPFPRSRSMPRKKVSRPDFLTRFHQQGPVPMAKNPLTVRVPEDIDAIVRAKTDRNQWLRDAILEKLYWEDELPKEYHDQIEIDE